MPAVELVAVSKTYRRRGRPPQKALDELDLLVEAGGVHGFLGPERLRQDDDDPRAARARPADARRGAAARPAGAARRCPR